MTPTSDIAVRALAPEAMLSRLDALVGLLQAANAVPEIADPVLLAQMVESLQGEAAAAALPGVPELLRSWQSALQDLARRGDVPGADDLTRMALWFGGLQEHLAGRLDRSGRRMLAELPPDIRWLPRLSQSFVLVIARRLEQAAEQHAGEQRAAADIAAPDARSAATTGATMPDAFSIAADTIGLFSVGSDPFAAGDATATVADAASLSEPDGGAFAFDDIQRPDAAAAPAFASIPQPAMSEDSPPASFATNIFATTNSTGDAIATVDSAIDSAVDAAVDTAIDGAANGAVGPDADDTIWIGQEELELTRLALAEQVLPLAQAWADTPDEAARAALAEELAYQCGLIANALELIGLAQLARGAEALREALERGDPAAGPDAVAIWCSALIGALDTPDRESAELVAAVAEPLSALDADWAQALGDELARVRVGMDPALLAQRKTVADFDDIGLAPAADVLPTVLEGMLRELPDNAARLGASVRALIDTGAAEPADEARRVAHTLKGDANTVGVRGLASITHALEDILIEIGKRPERLDQDCADLLGSAVDCVEEIADHLLGRGPAPDNLLDVYQRVLDAANALTAGGASVPAPVRADDAQTPPGGLGSAPVAAAQPIAQPVAQPAVQTTAQLVVEAAGGMAASGIQSLNVPSALLDELQRLSGETLVTSRQIDQQLERLGTIHREQRLGVRNSQELTSRLDDLVALRGAALQSTAQKAGAELDPLEIDQYNELHVISRQLLEAQADSAEFARRIDRIMSTLSDLRSDQEQLNRDLQRSILRTRTVPFGQVAPRLQRIVRQTAKQVFKQVHLEIVGEDIPIDAELLERIVEPLAHLLRNAIDHGIETPDIRDRAGKPDIGQLRLRIGLQGDAALIELQDDGAGLNPDAIRRRAIEVGLLAADADIDERSLIRMILLPGFSTRSTASEVSGRGIGMDVVNQRIAALRGTLAIASERGQGTRIQLRLPVTQTLANVVIARGQRQTSAIVAGSIERVVSFAAGECRYEDGRLTVELDGETVRALPIEAFYGETADLSPWLGANGTGLAVRDPDGRIAIVLVRAIEEVRSVVVKPLGAWVPPIPAVRGITQLGDGGLAPVIDLDVMMSSAQERRFDPAQLIHSAAPVTRVVVADDSLSVRRALEQLMQDAGFEVATARDGFEALAEIQARPTHALLVDLEMPRMNGLELTRNLRTQADTRDLPVVMITSRATDKHQAMAEQAGVTRMLGKPFSEDSLVALVRELIAERAG
jgi:chemosensory pili system protein ChpA (sensor histidine kinase/response regulator)